MIQNKKNIIFFISIILIIAIIGIFNYFLDPFKIMEYNSKQILTVRIPTNLYCAAIKLNRNYKYDYLVIGGSSGTMFDFNCKDKKIAVISINKITTKQMKDILTFFLDVHPEVKNVIIALDYMYFVYPNEIQKVPISKNTKNITLDEIYNMYFSINATLYSFKKIYDKENNIYENANVFCYFPNRYFPMLIDSSNDDTKKVIEDLKQIIKILQERNINIIFHSYPHKAQILAYIYDSDLYKTVENAKRVIVNKVGYMYDMGFINKYTTQVFSSNNYLFIDFIHPSKFWGNVFYDYIFTDNKRNDLIIKLTTDNIEDELKKERILIEEYIKTHKSEIEEYKSLYDYKNFTKMYCNNIKHIPEEILSYWWKY